MHCPHCQVLSINGVACHETGCPRQSWHGPYHVVRWAERDSCTISIYAGDEPIFTWAGQDALDLADWVCGPRDADILDYWESLGQPTN